MPMIRRRSSQAALAAVLLLLTAAGAPAVERAEIPEQYQWDLGSLYPGEAAWVAAKQELSRSIPALQQWQGRLGESATTLLGAMSAWEAVSLGVDRFYSYAFQLSDQDTRVARHQQMKQEASQVYTDFQTAVAFMRPELLAVGREKIDRFVAAEPRLVQYRMFFDDILRAAPHTLSPAEEKLVARAGTLAQTAGTVHSVFTGADLPYPEVTLSTGEKVRLDAAAYSLHRASPVKADREAVFKAFWERYGDFTLSLIHI